MFDTGNASSDSLTGEAMSKRPGWTELAEGDVEHVFKGDAALVNDRVACVLRRGSTGAEVYSLGPGRPVMRAVLAPAVRGENAKLISFR
ncbi:MAG TPA: hypothetical protein P5164_15435, partial [Thermoanaerobaculia bacterium]|nr:hypothetical protein [Thermoanaerobaculia bacterium]